MKTYFFSFFCLFFCIFSIKNAFFIDKIFAQSINFQVMDAETHKDIKDVQIIPRHSLYKNKVFKTDFLGKCAFIIALNDTISFDHEGFYPVHVIFTKYEAHDEKHPFVVYMTPTHSTLPRTEINNFGTLEDFEYNILHPKNKKNALQVRVLEDVNAIEKRKLWGEKTRTKYDNSFNIVDVKLKKKK